MLENGIGQAQIAFGIFEINGIHFMGHRRTAYFAFLRFLFEIVHGDIRPDIPAKINQDRIDAADVIEMRSKMIIVLNLCGVLLPLQTQFLRAEIIREAYPVRFGIGHIVCIEIARGPAELAGIRDMFHQCHLVFQSLHKYQDLLTQTGRRGRLPVRARQQGNVFPGPRHFFQLENNIGHTRQIHLLQRIAPHHGNSGIVNIL